MNYNTFNTHQRHKECPSKHESKGWLLDHASYSCLCSPMITAQTHMSHVHPADWIAEILLIPEYIIFCSCHVCSDRCPTVMTYPTFTSISTLQKYYQKIGSIILIICIPFYFAYHFSNNGLFLFSVLYYMLNLPLNSQQPGALWYFTSIVGRDGMQLVSHAVCLSCAPQVVKKGLTSA